MAGGKMGIYTGFWDKFQASDGEIANVMGHEIGHALASHTREKMSVSMGVGVGTALLAAVASSRNSSNPHAFQQTQNTVALAAALAITLPNSRDAESEADQIGIELAARAGYDPRAAVSLWEKMAKEGGTPAEFFPRTRHQITASSILKRSSRKSARCIRQPREIKRPERSRIS